ncbi:hypothetical protein [Porphyromonas sp.]|uniref:hypothetical protein n=1 Tax=Porphyromonas sp. TaxID=1924944 RepID=UPI0026DAFA0C|nr:hypothetical protein [Porphyromonas sp.]MDO4770429.1 hypothetical protein [Porphyromonas sp.]
MKGKDQLNLANIQPIMAVVMSVAGLVLLIVALLVPPQGEIDSSVLIAFGEILTFVGAVFGIDYTHRAKRQRDEE